MLLYAFAQCRGVFSQISFLNVAANSKAIVPVCATLAFAERRAALYVGNSFVEKQ